MGSFVFKWAHPASEVYVTGTFDDWKKSEKLEKVGDHFEKNVTLNDSSASILYKFVVDGEWVVDPTAPIEKDEGGNENNVLTAERIIAEAPATAAIINNIVPESTTAEMAGTVPIVEKKPAAAQQDSAVDAPGAFPETPAGEVSINPMPAAAGAVNPIKLAPGEKIPETVTAESTTSNVKLDAESYEKSDALPAGAAAVFASSVAPESTTAELAAKVPKESNVPEVVKESQVKAGAEPEASAIPAEVEEKAALEGELKDKLMEAPTTSEGTSGKGTEKTEGYVDPAEAAASVAAAATAAGAAAVAGAVAAKDAAVEKLSGSGEEPQAEETPKDVAPDVPPEVKASIIDASKDPEAAANAEAVQDKKAMEAELIKETTAGDAPKPGDIPRTEKTTSATPAAPETQPEAETNTKTNGATEAEKSTEAPIEKPAEKPAETTSTKTEETKDTPEKKKKNRLSTMIGKIKEKMHK